MYLSSINETTPNRCLSYSITGTYALDAPPWHFASIRVYTGQRTEQIVVYIITHFTGKTIAFDTILTHRFKGYPFKFFM